MGQVLIEQQKVKKIFQDFEIDATAMLVTSAFGVGVNIIMGASLHQHGHSHGGGSGGHAHGSGEEGHAHGGGEEGHAHAEKEKENINVKAAFIHVIGDFLQSLGKNIFLYPYLIVLFLKVSSSLLLSSTSSLPGSSLTPSVHLCSALWCWPPLSGNFYSCYQTE